MNSESWSQHALINTLQTMLLLAVMAGFLALLGWLLWDIEGAVMMLVMSLTLMLINPFVSPRLIMRFYRAQRLELSRLPGLAPVLTELTRRSGLKSMPDIYYIPSAIISAFSTGRSDDAVIGVTDGLLHTLNLRELSSVFAHELSHIRSNDMFVMGLADLFSRMTSMLSLFGQILLLLNLPFILLGAVSINWLLIMLLMLAPLLSTLAQLGLSRTREYHADLNAVRLTADPQGLASALVHIERIQGNWIERLFLPGKGIPEPSLLRTHPPTSERVRRLLSIRPSSEHGALWQVSHNDPLSHELESSRVKRRPGWHIGGLWH